MHSLENLPRIPKELDATLHPSDNKKAWNEWYRTNPQPTREELLDFATTIDDKFSSRFLPPVR